MRTRAFYAHSPRTPETLSSGSEYLLIVFPYRPYIAILAIPIIKAPQPRMFSAHGSLCLCLVFVLSVCALIIFFVFVFFSWGGGVVLH